MATSGEKRWPPVGVFVATSGEKPMAIDNQLTSEGRRLAVFLTKTYTRIVNPSLAELDPTLPPDIADRAPLAKTWRAFEHALQDQITQAAIAA